MPVERLNGLDRHHLSKAIDKFIEDNRPKEIGSYKENGVTIRVFEPPMELKR